MTDIITFYANGFRTLRYTLRRLWRWSRLHPRIVALSLFGGWVGMVVFGNAYAAHAADGAGAGAAAPFLAGLTATDTDGLPIYLYAQLPIDRGDMMSPMKGVIAIIIDIIWIGHIGAISWMISFLDWLISFEWVDWIATPLNTFAENYQTAVGELNWIPFALSLAGGVAGFVMWSGRYAAGAMDLLISVACAALAVGILANPVATITGEDGALRTVQSWGNELATAITTDGDTEGAPEDALSESITSPLVTTFIRLPAQNIAFGRGLQGECDTVFTDQMNATAPIQIGDNTVRDRVGDCDPLAKFYVQNPNVGQIGTALMISIGAFILFIFSAVLALLLVGTILFTLWAAVRTMVNVYVAVAPAVARQALWRSLMGMGFGLLSVIGMLVILTAFLTILVAVLEASSALGIVMQMNFVSTMLAVMIGTLVWFRWRAKKAGDTLAEHLSKLGLGRGAGPRPNRAAAIATMGEAARFASHYASRPRAPKQLPAPTRPLQQQGPVDGGHLISSPVARPPAPTHAALTAGSTAATPETASQAAHGGRRAAKTADLVFTAANVAKAAPGGPGAVAGKIALEVGRRGASKALESKTKHAGGHEATSMPTPSVPDRPAPRNIVVDSNGIGHIHREANVSPPVYNVSSLPPVERSARNVAVRAALTKARPVQG